MTEWIKWLEDNIPEIKSSIDWSRNFSENNAYFPRQFSICCDLIEGVPSITIHWELYKITIYMFLWRKQNVFSLKFCFADMELIEINQWKYLLAFTATTMNQWKYSLAFTSTTLTNEKYVSYQAHMGLDSSKYKLSILSMLPAFKTTIKYQAPYKSGFSWSFYYIFFHVFMHSPHYNCLNEESQCMFPWKKTGTILELSLRLQLNLKLWKNLIVYTGPDIFLDLFKNA